MLSASLAGVFAPIPLVYEDPYFAFIDPAVVTPPVVYSIDAMTRVGADLLQP